MAPYAAILLLAMQFPCYQGKVVSILSPQDLSCDKDTEYFDIAGLLCSKCDENSHLVPDFSVTDNTGNALGCKCPSSYLSLAVECSSDELRQAMCEETSCASTCQTLAQAVSIDGSHCIECASGSAYDIHSNECTCSNPRKRPASNTPIDTRRLVEIYNGSMSTPIRKDCIPCPQGTAVISTDLYADGEHYFQTAGMTYTSDPYTCASCPDPNMFFDTDYNCVCDSAKGYIIVGEPLLGRQGCIKYMPSIANDYDKVSFYSVQDPTARSHVVKVDVHSAVFSHYYLKAAAECEYCRRVNVKGFAACQALGNLCVMQLYDGATSACRLLRNIISEERSADYRGQAEWKYTLPWLTYEGNSDDISSDRGIQMKMSFGDREGYSHILKFKLAKYDLDGTFMGFEDLTTQFLYCSSSVLLTTAEQQTEQGHSFGVNRRFETNCHLTSVANMKMYFYDFYVVDEGSTSCRTHKLDSGQCLYPVPVLNRNQVEDGLYPNMIAHGDHQMNKKFSRRFFLVDNQAGRTHSGLSVVRYAKTITLRTTLQSERNSEGHIYPPQLIIEYVERSATDLDFIERLQFNIEYSMDTSDYWSTIKIITGFVGSVAGSIWLFRVYKWYTRVWKPGLQVHESFSNGTEYTIHVLMLACHSFVWVFGPFVFLLCFYWFILFKFQAVVFFLMPEENTLSGTSNEYDFFYALFQGIFWAHTMYLAYKIYTQGTVDIFFVDWEKPRNKQDEVSAWRVIMIANQWNKMQSMRKNSIEYTLFWMSFLLTGLNLRNLATTRPNLGDTSNGPINIVLQIANTTLWWCFVSLCQWIWRSSIYERYFSEPHSQKFVDVCTVAKVSLFIFDEPYHGYYLHCRSPHEIADCSMFTLQQQLKHEESGYSTGRGLDDVNIPPGCQTFELFTTPAFQRHLSKISSSFMTSKTPRQSNLLFAGGTRLGLNPYERINGPRSLAEAHAFLQIFVDQSPPPENDGYRWMAQNPTFVESVLGVHVPLFGQTESRSVLTPDTVTWLHDNSFLSTTFLGIEVDLVLHDILTFNLIDLLFENSAAAILGTYIMHLLRAFVRARLGRANIAKKTQVDERFLL